MALKVWEDSNRVMVIDKLRNLVEAKDKLVHMLSHELRTPILGIMGEEPHAYTVSNSQHITCTHLTPSSWQIP